MITSTWPSRRGLSWVGGIGVALLMLCLQPLAHAGGGAVDGEIIVRLRARGEIAPLLVKHQLSLIGRFGGRPIFRLKVIGDAKVEDKVKLLSKEPDVKSAEPNVTHESPEERKNVAWAIGDPDAYEEQWAMQAVRLADAHRYSTGTGMRIAVLDTGVDRQHPTLAGRLSRGFDFVDFDNDPSEVGSEANRGFGHGTHVAGLVALVAPHAKIMPLRVLDAEGKGNVWVLAEAMLYAVDPDGDPRTDDGAHVINLSLGALRDTRIFKTVAKLVTCKKWWANAAAAYGDDEEEDDDSDEADDENGNDDVAYAVDKERCGGFGGAVVVAAAGNRASDKIREYPAAEKSPGLLSVGASDNNGRLAAFSNYGWVKIAAPGEGVTSTVPGGGYGTWSGTSMAAPIVAGAAALLRATDRGLPVDKVVRQLKKRTDKLCGASLKQLDIAAALSDESAGIKRDCK